MVVAVRAVKAGATTALAGTAIVLTLGGAMANPGDEAAASTEPSVGPGRARRPSTRAASVPRGWRSCSPRAGETRTVPFKQGWKIYRGERPGTLLAVCPD